jgi:hypothetical protein
MTFRVPSQHRELVATESPYVFIYSLTSSRRTAALDQTALDHETLNQKASTLHQQCSDTPSRPPPSCTSDQRRYNNLLQSFQTTAATVEWTSGPVSVQSAWVVDNGRRGGEYSWSKVVGWASGRRQQGKKTLKAKGASKSCCLWVDLWSSRIEKRATYSLSNIRTARQAGRETSASSRTIRTHVLELQLTFSTSTIHDTTARVHAAVLGGVGGGGGEGGVAYRSRSLVYISDPCCFCYAAAHLGVLRGRLFTDKKLALCLPTSPPPLAPLSSSFPFSFHKFHNFFGVRARPLPHNQTWWETKHCFWPEP